jgi:UDP-N-acetylmuramoyl-L-alanyl-D-glutamate--2,6-diaminopimelate ligase
LRAACGASGRRGRLFVVFGCGGDRDTSKRAQMGQAAIRDADVVVVTSDNPRTEDPQRILDMIVEGISEASTRGAPVRLERAGLSSAGTGYFVEPDRRQAIQAAITAARPEDVVLIAGKGHEDYQIIGTTKHHFSDHEVVLETLKGL